MTKKRVVYLASMIGISQLQTTVYHRRKPRLPRLLLLLPRSCRVIEHNYCLHLLAVVSYIPIVSSVIYQAICIYILTTFQWHYIPIVFLACQFSYFLQTAWATTLEPRHLRIYRFMYIFRWVIHRDYIISNTWIL